MIFPYPVLNDDLMIVGSWDSHPISALHASSDIISSVSCVCVGFSSLWPEYNTTHFESNIWSPICIQSISLIPFTARLYFLISVVIWLVLPFSHIVPIFQLPMLIVILVVGIGIGLVITEKSRILSCSFIVPLNEDSLTPMTEFKWFKWYFMVSFF